MPNRQTVQNRQQERRKEALQVALEEAVYQELIWLRRQVIGKLNRSQLQKAEWKDNLLKAYADHASIWTVFQKRLHDSMMAAISLHGIDILQAEINAHLERGVEPFTYDYDYWLESYSDSLALMVTKVSDTTQKYIGDRITRWFQTPGETVQTVVNDLQTMFEPYRAQAIAQTEITRMDSSMQTGLAETLGIETWAWATRRDSLVCQRKLVGPDGNIYNGCRELHGMIFNMSDKMPPDGSHINCRCNSRLLRNTLIKVTWAEDKHPRAKDGRFGAKEGGAEKPKTVAGALRVKAAENKNAAPEVRAQKITALARKHFGEAIASRIVPLIDNAKMSQDKVTALIDTFNASDDPKDAFNQFAKQVKNSVTDKAEFNRALMNSRNRYYQKLHGAHLMEKPVKVKTEEKPAEKPNGKVYDPNKQPGRITRLDGGGIKIDIDYDPDFVVRAKRLGGKWDRTNRVWEFDKDSSIAAEKYFDANFNDINDQDIIESREKHKQLMFDAAKTEAEKQYNDTDATYDPNKKSGRMVIKGDRVSIISDYHPGFVQNIKNIQGRKWDGDNKSWSIPITQYEAGKKVFDRYYNNLDNKTLKQEAQKIRADEQKVNEENAKITPASIKQREYIDLLGRKYMDTNGNPITAASFGDKLNKHYASQIIDGLKGGEEQVSYMGIFERGGDSPDPYDPPDY